MKKVDDDKHRYLSSVCIRNSEVLDELFGRIKAKRGNLRMSDDSKIFGTIYGEIANFEIATYDYDYMNKEDGVKDYYTIKFPMLSILADLFDDAGFVRYFTKIYDRKEDSGEMETLVMSLFKDFLESPIKKKQSTIISRLKKNYKDVYDIIGEDSIKDQFSDTNRQYTTEDQIKGLAKILMDNPYSYMSLFPEPTNGSGQTSYVSSESEDAPIEQNDVKAGNEFAMDSDNHGLA